ncbi:MAG: AAA family ATPase [Parvibaculum sp.]|uniref:AAA family ATPase n=1 Tax=Alphaproteobacteria TaxID=28211 RepID=UPI001B0E72F1|nr:MULTISPECIES: AAA family ATPase [Alphaproteobacteria]MBO6635265.1 AAA family ATPase [Parvibaculum sp.]
MKLRSLALNQFKKFTSPVRLDGIENGLNVVVGPNEMGKSTLLDALRAALFEKYSSKAQPITALQNDRNQAGPVVELAFELDDGVYRITKRFVKRPYARLSCPDGRTLEGDVAEDALRDLLRFDEPGKTGAKAETLGMWNVLWVQQGHSFGALDLPQSARANLHGALESEVGTVLGGRRGRALPQAIEKQLGELVTSGGKPRGAYKELIDNTETLKTELAGLQGRRDELSRTLDQLEQAQETLARLSTGDRDEADETELADARKRHGHLAELEARIDAANSDLALKQRNLEQANQVLTERAALRQAIADEGEVVETARKGLEDVRTREREARARLDELRTAVREAEAAVTAADDAVSHQRRILVAVERQARIRELEGRREKATAAEERHRKARQDAAAILVTDEALTEIRDAAKALETIDGRLGAAATRITFDMTADALSGIEVDGRKVAVDDPPIQAVGPTTIAIPGRGRITVEPAIKDRDKLRDQQREARTALETALQAGGVKTLDDAEDQHKKRQRLVQDGELARQEAAMHAPATDDHDAGAEALAGYVESLQLILTRDLTDLEIDTLPTKQEVDTELRTALGQAEEARSAVDTARAALGGPEEALGALQTELGTVRTRFDDSGARLEKRRAELMAAEADQADAALQAAIEAAEKAVAYQEDIIAGLKNQRTDETVPQLEARIGRLEQAIKDRREKRGNLRETIAGLRSHIEVLEGAGLDEAIEQKARELERATDDRRRAEREARVLGLLLATLRAAEQEAKERYLSPVLNRVRPYLQLLFPGAEITIDEDLRIIGVTREAGYEEAFHHLSIGTQEQIAVLIRLAFAEMLVEQGHPATVILDDALVFSDDRRMNRMFDILNMAARNVQVVIFTCREQLFEELGGRQLSLQAGSAEELVSA